MKDPLTAAKLSGFWVLLSLFQVALLVDKVLDFRSSGRPVGGWIEARTCFWVVILMFWMWNGWNNFRKYRDERREVEAGR